MTEGSVILSQAKDLGSLCGCAVPWRVKSGLRRSFAAFRMTQQ
jgi:hypothetical protein